MRQPENQKNLRGSRPMPSPWHVRGMFARTCNILKHRLHSPHPSVPAPRFRPRNPRTMSPRALAIGLVASQDWLAGMHAEAVETMLQGHGIVCESARHLQLLKTSSGAGRGHSIDVRRRLRFWRCWRCSCSLCNLRQLHRAQLAFSEARLTCGRPTQDDGLH